LLCTVPDVPMGPQDPRNEQDRQLWQGGEAFLPASLGQAGMSGPLI
jgi:hypothetical protein